MKTIHCREFHELAMDCRAAPPFAGASAAYEALCNYIDARLQTRDYHASDAYIAFCNAQLQVYADDEVASWVVTVPPPIDMVLYCPSCGLQHIDKACDGWGNPPHRSHLCHGCNHVWRPADVPTNGVAAVRTVGKVDSPSVRMQSALGRPISNQEQHLRIKVCEQEHPRVAAYPHRLSDAEIRHLFLNHGFVIKSGQADLKDYVFAAAHALMDAVIGDKP